MYWVQNFHQDYNLVHVFRYSRGKFLEWVRLDAIIHCLPVCTDIISNKVSLTAPCEFFTYYAEAKAMERSHISY